MYKGNLIGVNMDANTDIPFTTVFNTNGNVSVQNGVVTFLVPGTYKVEGILNLTGVIGNVTASIMNGGTAITEANAGAFGAATTDAFTIPIHDVIVVNGQTAPAQALISIRLSAAATITNSVISVSRVA